MTKEEILKKNNKPNGRGVVTCYNIIHEDDALRAMQEYADQESNRFERVVMQEIAGKDLHIVYSPSGKPYGIRTTGGYLLFFPTITEYTNQKERYIKEIDEQNTIAGYLLEKLSNFTA